MATFFGEILPVTSRAVDDDEDDDEIVNQENNPAIHWSKKVSEELEKLPERKLSCSSFIIAIGAEATAFTEIYVKHLGYECIGGISTSLEEDDSRILSQMSPTDKVCHIYRSCTNPCIIVCQCNRDVSPDQSYAWTKLLLNNIDLASAYIVILTSCSTGSYHSDIPATNLDAPFLRALKTDNFTGSPVCKILEQPNMLTGLSAQLMTFFQVYQYKAVAYVCFKETRYLNIEDVKAFIPVLQMAPLKGLTEPNKNANQMLKSVAELHTFHDTMYM